MQHGFTLARQLLARQSGTKQIIMITDGEPTAHVTPSGDVFFNYPPVTETVEATLREVLRCTREGIRINTFMLDATSYLTAFVERLTEINRGRAFFTTPETLGDYVLVDFIEHKRSQARSRGPPAPADAAVRASVQVVESRDPPLRVRDVVCDNHTDVITTLSSVRSGGHQDHGRGSSTMYDSFESTSDPGDHGWQDEANCLGVDPDLFFPERGASTREAKEVCRGCSVREECLEFALQNGEKFGIWGGLSERERRRIRRQRAASRPQHPRRPDLLPAVGRHVGLVHARW